MIRLENLEALEPAGLREEAQGELEQLADELCTEGFQVTVAGLEESVSAHLEESAEQAFVEAINLVLDSVIDATTVLTIEAVVRRWARRRRRFRDRDGAKACAYIWGPNGDVLAVVELPEPTNEDSPSEASG